MFRAIAVVDVSATGTINNVYKVDKSQQAEDAELFNASYYYTEHNNNKYLAYANLGKGSLREGTLVTITPNGNQTHEVMFTNKDADVTIKPQDCKFYDGKLMMYGSKKQSLRSLVGSGVVTLRSGKRLRAIEGAFGNYKRPTYFDAMNASAFERRNGRSLLAYLELAQNIRSFKEMRAAVFGMSIRATYSQVAFLSLKLDELDEARRFFYKGAKITAETFNIFKGNRYPHLRKVGPLPFTSLFVKSFPDAVLCGRPAMLTEYATAIYEDAAPSQGLVFNSEIMQAIRSLILGDLVNAKQFAERAHQHANFKGPYAGFSHAVKGIIDNDLERLNEGLRLRLKFTARIQSTPYSITLVLKRRH